MLWSNLSSTVAVFWTNSGFWIISEDNPIQRFAANKLRKFECCQFVFGLEIIIAGISTIKNSLVVSCQISKLLESTSEQS